jgi:hypothetical protein
MNRWSLAYRTQGGSEYVADLCALTDQCLYHLNGTRNSRVSGHGIRIVLYALVRLLTVIILLKYVTWSIYTETDVPLISQCFVSRGWCASKCSDYLQVQ